MAELSTRERNPYYTCFPWGWYGVHYSDELAVGEVKPLHYFDRPLVLWRDAEGGAHLMDAFCPHLGAHLGHGGRVEGLHLVCPFHHWHWDGAGRNACVPYGPRPHPKARVGVYPTVERNGLVLCWYHPGGAPPSFEIPEVPEYYDDGYSDYHKASWTIRTTWQETAENGPDFVHLRSVHGTPVLPELESYECDGVVASMRAKVTYHSPKGDTAGRIDTDSYGPGFSTARFRGIIDLCMVDWCVPIDYERIENHKGYLVSRKDGERKVETVGRALVRELVHQMDQDIAIFEKKIFVPRPALVEGDGPIMKFRRWAAQFYEPSAEGRRPRPAGG
jgi:nitrite reductase/ring-hydroxylating ferredoxin subunit